MKPKPFHGESLTRTFNGIWPGPGLVVSFADGADGITTTRKNSVATNGRIYIHRSEELLATQKGWKSVDYCGDLVAVER